MAPAFSVPPGKGNLIMSKKNETDTMLAGRISDLARSSEYEVRTSVFLTPAEQKAAYDAALRAGASDRLAFWGGAPECERRLAVFLPEWMTPDSSFGGAFDEAREEIITELSSEGVVDRTLSGAIVPLEVTGSAYSELDHRDYLGAVLALGLERDAVGDIIVTSPSGAVIFALAGAARAIEEELSSVGRESVSVRRAELPAGFRATREFEAITDTVMSPRLDAIVSALCRVSRDASASMIARGDVALNYGTASKPDAQLSRGDVITVRGYGKYVYDGDRGVNRRGRLRIDARKYV